MRPQEIFLERRMPRGSLDHEEEVGEESDASEEAEAHNGCSFDISLIANLRSLFLKDLLSDEAYIIPQEPSVATVRFGLSHFQVHKPEMGWSELNHDNTA
jgi:hypothetical protein